MSVKFISLILGASMTITSLTAAPVQAGDKDLARALAAIAGIAIVGAVVHDNSKRKKSRAVSRGHNDYGYHAHQPHRAHKGTHRSHKKQRRQAAREQAYRDGYNAHRYEVQQRRAERRAARRAQRGYGYGHGQGHRYSARPYSYGY